MKKRLAILLWTSFFINLAAGLFGPLYAVFVEEIGGNLIHAGFAYSIFSIFSGGLIYFIGRWEDRFKHQENLLVASRFLACIAFFGYIFISNVYELYAIQLFLGIAFAIGSPAFSSLYSKNLQKGKYASQWGMWDSMYGVTVGISAIIGGYIAQFYGFRPLFVLMFIISVISFIVSLMLVKKKLL
jgi:MFS family permease